jgi:hypothetical protein
LKVEKLIEGNIELKASKFDAKMVNGDIVNINCTSSVSIGAVYSKNLVLKAQSGVEIQGVHGNLQVAILIILK